MEKFLQNFTPLDRKITKHLLDKLIFWLTIYENDSILLLLLLKNGIKMSITIKDIAHECGVGVATISRAINDSGYVKKALKQKILNNIKNHNWQPSANAQSLKTGSRSTVAIVVNTFNHHPNPIILEFLISKLRKNTCFSTISSSEDSNFIKKELKSFLSRQIKTVITLLPLEEYHEELALLHSNGIQVISLQGRHACKDILNIAPDNYAYGAFAMNYLIKKGHKKIAFLGLLGKPITTHSIKDFQVHENYLQFIRGIYDVARRNGIKFDLNNDIVSDNFGNLDILKKLLMSKKHTALICQSGSLLTDVYCCCREKNIKIPKDISIISLEGESSFRAYNPVPVYLDNDFEAISNFVIEVIFKDKGCDCKDYLFNPIFIKGKSVCSY